MLTREVEWVCWSGRWDGFEADGEAQAVGFLGHAAHGAFRVVAGEVVGAKVSVAGLVAQDVPDRDGELARDRDQSPLPTAAGSRPWS